MKTLDWYFDFVSPFSYLQFEQLQRLPHGVRLRFKPVLLAALLQHWGSKGPAEIPPMRRFTYRHVLWLARRNHIPMRMPPAHPFNPLRALRLALALDSRHLAVQEIFRFLWRDGGTTEDTQAWTALAERLGLRDAEARIRAPEVKDELRRNTGEAIAAGVFGVPTFVVDGELFWGFDATAMLLDYLEDPGLLQDAEMVRVSDLPEGVQRK